MADDTVVAESSTATEATPSFEDPGYYQNWRLKGELPAKPAATPPAEVVETTPPANSPATPAETKESDEAVLAGEKNPRTKARIQEFLRERAELKARISELEKNGKPESKKADQPAPAATTDGPKPPVKPDKNDPKYALWEDYEAARDKYLEDLVDYKAEVKAAELVEKAETKRAERDKGNEVATGWNKRVEATKAKHADFDSVAKNVPFNETAATYLLDPENDGPELLYHLGSNLEDAERIKGLSPTQTIKELTRIEDSLKKPAPGPKKVPAAHAPPTEVGTNASATDDAEAAGAAGDYTRYKKLADAKDIAARKR